MRAQSLPLILVALALAGCSNGSGSKSSTAATTTAATSSSSTSATTSSVTAPPANFALVGFETLEIGASSPRGVNQGAHETHVATASDWASFWPTHSPTTTLPSVDFTQESVVGTFMAQITGAAHRTQLINVSRDSNSDDLHAVVREFKPLRVVTRVMVTPFHMVRCQTAVNGQGALTVDRQSELDFETLLAGTNNALGVGNPNYTGGLEVVRDAASFNALFAQIQPSTRPPAVDFTREMVVAVLGATIPTFGNSVQTLRIVHDPTTDELRVISRVNPYNGGAPPPPAVESPFQLLRVTPASGTVRPEQISAVTQTPLADGTSTIYRGGTEALVIRDAATFATEWTQRVGGPIPQVDFAVDQVLMAFEPTASRRLVSINQSALLENDELAVTVHSMQVFGAPSINRYSMVTVPKNHGPVVFETVDTTPRP